jgi:hypothetical protein
VLELLVGMYGKRARVRAWIHTPHPDLGGTTPMSLVLDGKADVVRDMLEAALAGIPMLAQPALGAATATIPVVNNGAIWWLAVADEYLTGPPPGAPSSSAPQPLFPGGSARFGARLTPKGGPPAVYLASDPNVACSGGGGCAFASREPRPSRSR